MSTLKSITLKLDNVYPSSYYNSQPKVPTIILPSSSKNRLVTYVSFNENFIHNLDNSNILNVSPTNVVLSIILLYVVPDAILAQFSNDAKLIMASTMNVPVYQYVAEAKAYASHNHVDNVQLLVPAGMNLIGFRVSSQTGTTVPNASAFYSTITYVESD